MISICCTHWKSQFGGMGCQRTLAAPQLRAKDCMPNRLLTKSALYNHEALEPSCILGSCRDVRCRFSGPLVRATALPSLLVVFVFSA
jgi:hypothetical protein